MVGRVFIVLGLVAVFCDVFIASVGLGFVWGGVLGWVSACCVGW